MSRPDAAFGAEAVQGGSAALEGDGRVIRGSAWEPAALALKHVFLVGDLRRPAPHPFFRDARVELIATRYAAGDHGLHHWHRVVTEYEVVTSGRIGYADAADGTVVWLEAGDVHTVAPGRCVRRLVEEPATTLAVKVPSAGDDKVHCAACPRACPSRAADGSGSMAARIGGGT